MKYALLRAQCIFCTCHFLVGFLGLTDCKDKKSTGREDKQRQDGKFQIVILLIFVGQVVRVSDISSMLYLKGAIIISRCIALKGRLL